MHVISEYVNHEYIGLARELTLQKLLSMLIAAAQLEQAPENGAIQSHGTLGADLAAANELGQTWQHLNEVGYGHACQQADVVQHNCVCALRGLHTPRALQARCRRIECHTRHWQRYWQRNRCCGDMQGRQSDILVPSCKSALW